MKERILESLFDFGMEDLPKKSEAMFHQLTEELNISTSELKKKSVDTLKEILHNYAYFDVSTIDKFTHRIIRTFAKDLNLPQNFEPIVETDLLLEEAVARVILKAGTDDRLTKILIDFAHEKIEDDRSWDVTFDLNKIGVLLFNENHSTHLERLSTKKVDSFLDLKKTITDRIVGQEKELILVASNVLKSILENGLEFEDFPRQTLPNHFKKIKDQEFGPSKLYNNKLEENLKDGKVLKAGLEPPSDEFGAQLLKAYLNLKDLIYNRSFLKNALDNIVPLTVLSFIQQEIDAIGKERDQIPIFKFNQIISKEIKDQPAPFIYERLGEKYRNYFIDEFQDTSVTQWNNLVPLIDNALASEGGSLFLVGDAKQAIYRWRGGKAELLLNLLGGQENPFIATPHTEILPVNYRSHEEIVNFNNAFFSMTGQFLENPIYSELFQEGCRQRPTAKKGGLVQISFIEKGPEKNIDELYCQEVLVKIEEVRAKNYSQKDICILVRSNGKGAVLADYLTQHGIAIISSESLLLNSNQKVRFLINLLRFSSGFQEAEIAYEILAFLSYGDPRQHQFIHLNLHELEKLFHSEYGFSIAQVKRLSVFDALEYAIKQFDLAPNSDAYITFLMDVVIEVEQRNGDGAQSFLAYWEKKKGKLAITASENVDAIRIMTIHKSKGLEFPIVIFPFANERIYKRQDKKIWVPVEANSLNGFDEVLLSEKEELSEYPNKASAIFSEEKEKIQLDALNVLYVAMTRAQKGLYIITEKTARQSSKDKIGNYSDLFSSYLKDKQLWAEEQNTYIFGSLDDYMLSKNIETIKKNIPYQYSYKDRSAFKILNRSGMLWNTEREKAISHGNLIHYILGLIKTKKDLNKAIDSAIKNGDIASHDAVTIYSQIERIMNHTDLKEFFTEEYTILNERSILTDKGQILRPDRIVIKDGKATIIDYKTGKKDPKYKEQIYSYSDALEKMGYKVENKIIIYINEQINPEFI